MDRKRPQGQEDRHKKKRMFLPPKKLHVHEEVLFELMKGAGSLKLKEMWGKEAARKQCHTFDRKYDTVWYFAAEEAQPQ